MGPSEQIPSARKIAPGETRQIGVWEGIRIPCLMI